MAFVCLYIGVRPQDSIHLFEQDVKRIVRISEPSSKAIHPEVDTLAQTK
jgi:hypothetical protein